jgi:hypothetical protein
MSLIKAQVPKDFKEEVTKASKTRGISESRLIQTAVKNFLRGEYQPPKKP